MASTTIPLPLLCLPLLLLLPQISHSARVPVPEHKNLTQPSNTYIVHADHLAKPSDLATLDHWYTSMVATHSPRAVADPGRILYTYDTVMHGFAVELTGDEARRMSEAPGVIGVYEDRRLRPLTTRSPGFLGLDPGFGAWRDTDSGDGVIIGFVDSGVWPESPSFSDEGLGPVRSSWRGTCVDAVDFNASLCNNKLVGARFFSRASPTPMDRIGHGTDVASTAAGSEVRDAGVLHGMFARGTARGVAPKARVAMYKACSQEDCYSSDIVMALDAAVKDGVDIVSLSLGDDDHPPFYNDSVAIAAFGARREGVFVVLAAGNGGPAASTVDNVAPWMTTVGAGTMDRLFPAALNLGDGAVLTGQSLYATKANGTAQVPLLFTSCSPEALTPARIMGKVVVCSEAGGSDATVARAGGAGIVLVDDHSWFRGGVGAREFIIPGVYLSYTAGEKLRSYMASVPYPTASFTFACETVIGENRAPTVWTASSRGPNPLVPELLKPDVIAPGVAVLAATIGDGVSLGKPRSGVYALGSGTSMACPHVAGVAALIKKKHPGWTPEMIRSALMTTAATLDSNGRAILDNGVVDRNGNNAATAGAATPFAAGAGHVRPQLAMDPGLVYDAGAMDYVDFLCALNYTAEQLRRFAVAPDLATCARAALPGGPAGLNYPSFVVAFDGRTDARTLTRTVTKVSENAETYKVIIAAPEHVKVTVTPTTLEFKQQYEKRSYTVEFRNEAGGDMTARSEFGHIIWENQKHQVRSPVAFIWKTNN